jgi:pimeloyl-ACP methyl ester carboxylesterase
MARTRPSAASRLPILVAAVAVALSAAGCDLAVAPGTPTPAPPTPTPTEAPPGPVRFMTSDGIELEGEIFGSGPKAVVLAHMRPADMTSWVPMAEVLADNGYRALVFNFRGYGNSGGSGFAVDVDVRAAIDFMAAQGATGVALAGASMGATGSIAAAEGHPIVRGIFALSPPYEFEGVDAQVAGREVEVPILIIVADRDELYTLHAVELGRAHPELVQIVTMTGTSHGTELFDDHGPAVATRMMNFIAGVLD